MVSSKGISADPEIRAARNWPRSRDLTEIRGFLAIKSYYHRFIEPTQAYREGTLKAHVITSPIIASPTDEDEYVLDTDASQEGLGAALHQQQGDRLAVITYASRILSATERYCSTSKQETLTVVFALKAFRQFLLGHHLRLPVDHSALTYLRSTPEVMGQAARWLDFTQEFDFSCEHRAGRLHGNCDALSRKPPEVVDNVQLYAATETERNEGTALTCCRVNECSQTAPMGDITDMSNETVAVAQRNDPVLLQLITALEAGEVHQTWPDVP